MLTEAEVERSFRRLFSSPNFEAADVEKGEALLDELRPESPLRHRLSNELKELKKLCAAKG